MKSIPLLGAFLLLTLFCGMQLPAQAYHPFPLHETSLFTAWDGSDTALFAMRIDSARIDGADSAFYPFRIMHPLNAQTLDCNGMIPPPNMIGANLDHYLGRKMLRAANGDCRFVFSSGDTFHLRTWAPVGDRWEWQAGDTVTVDSIVFQSVLGQMDSVKYFTLQSGPQMALSRSHGFVTVPSFIPYVDTYGSIIYNISFQLYAIPTMGLGAHMSDYAEIFQFAPGDRFGFIQYNDQDFNHRQQWLINCTIQSQVPGSRFTYIASCDTVHIVHLFNLPVDSTYHPAGLQTLQFDSLQSPPFPSLPRETAFVPWPGGYLVQTGAYLIAGTHGRIRYDYRQCYNYDPCAEIFLENINYPIRSSYATGLGQVMEGHSFSVSSAGFDLVCYEKGSDTWGTCLDLGSLIAVSPSLEGNVTLSPNPSAGLLRLEWNAEWTRVSKTINILSVDGKHVRALTQAAGTAALDLDMSDLAAGMYVLHVAAEGAEDAYMRFMVAK